MARVKFSITFEIPENQIKETCENDLNFLLTSESKKRIATNIIAVQILETELMNDNLKAKDFKIKVYE